jgi:hypothetical protein
MRPRDNYHARLAPLAVVAGLVLSNCSSLGDFGRLNPVLVTDDMHGWVGAEATQSIGGPVSHYRLTDDERTLRDLAFPLIEPPYNRQRWDAVVYEYGIRPTPRRELWVFDVTAYYKHLQEAPHRSTAGRYSQLIDDIRNDIVRIDPFFVAARRVVDLDRKREQTMQGLASIKPAEQLDARARIGENSLTIAWVYRSLAQRCASYRFALEHLVVAEPEPQASDAERVLAQLQQTIAANEVVPAAPVALGPAPALVSK